MNTLVSFFDGNQLAKVVYIICPLAEMVQLYVRALLVGFVNSFNLNETGEFGDLC
jgi:hypothetical protein